MISYMIEIREALTKKEQKEFLWFPLKMYKKNKCFVPPLYGDEKKIFNKNYHYYDFSEAKYFNAYRDGKMVGRISAIYHFGSNEKWNQKRVRFTRFDSINDQEVANALFKAVEDYAREKGMNEIVGPLGFSDLEREGLLIEGFDELSTFEEQYNAPYYKDLIENLGYQKEVDWEERQIFYPKNHNDKLKNIVDRVMKRYNLHAGNAKTTRSFIKKYKDDLFRVYEETYKNIYMSVPLSDDAIKNLLSGFKLLVNVRHIQVLLDENENVVCFGMCLPSIGKAVQKSSGRLTPLTILKILKSRFFPKVVDLAFVGVDERYANKGVAGFMFLGLMNILSDKRIKYAETNLNLETNTDIINNWKLFDSRLHKRRRSYVKKID